MRLTLQKEKGNWLASEVQEVHLDFLRMAGDDAALGDFPEGRGRLYPSPLTARDALQDEEFIGDWREYVSSDLEMRFAGDVGIFLSDLDDATDQGTTQEPEEKLFRLEVPLDHGMAWFSTLNQARLMLDLKHSLHADETLETDSTLQESPGTEDPGRLFVLMRYEFYSWIQEWLVQHVLSA